MSFSNIRPLLAVLGLLLVPIAATQAQTQAQASAAAAHTTPVREQGTPEARKEILQVLDQWKQAVIGKDRAALQRFYHDDLSYGHTDGEVLGKAQQIDRTLAPDRKFTAIDITDAAVRVYGNVALVTAGFAFHVAKEGGETVSALSGVDVWLRQPGGWQLVARQLTRPAARIGAASLDLQKAAEIQRSIIAFDNHVDVPFDYGSAGLDAAADGSTQIDLPKLDRGIVKAAAIAIFVPQGPRTPAGTAEARKLAQQKYEIISTIASKHPDRAAIAQSPEELKRIVASGRFAIVLTILNGNAIGDDLSQLDAWQKKGVRVVGFTHAGNNDLADSARPNLLRGDKLDEHGGLSALGKKAVTRLNDLGVVIDVSQLSASALAQVLSLTRAPVVASHSNARAIIDHPRNLSDEQLLAIRRNGGVVAVNAYSSWIRPLPPAAKREANDVRRKYGVPEEDNIAAAQPLTPAGVKVLSPEQFAAYSTEIHKVTGDPAYRATVAEYVDQLEYVVRKIGIDHVGISSDFNHGGGVIGWNNEGESLNVTAELLRRGYSRDDIAKLWGGNFLRIWGQVQSLARK
jgi:membrane dipeptidase